MDDQAMEEAQPAGQDWSEPFDVAVAIWGDSPDSGTGATQDPAVTDIWGHATVPAPRADDHDEGPTVQWPDLWGDHEGRRSRPDDLERRHGPLPAGGPNRFSLPEWWAVPPKPRSLWRQRLHRR